jgi:hypothetical protein
LKRDGNGRSQTVPTAEFWLLISDYVLSKMRNAKP